MELVEGEDLAQRVVERKALERYLSSSIVERVLANPDQIHLGGENQTATVMFTGGSGGVHNAPGINAVGIWKFSKQQDLAKEFGFQIRSFHHGIEAYKIADLLARNGRRAEAAAELRAAVARLSLATGVGAGSAAACARDSPIVCAGFRPIRPPASTSPTPSCTTPP